MNNQELTKVLDNLLLKAKEIKVMRLRVKAQIRSHKENKLSDSVIIMHQLSKKGFYKAKQTDKSFIKHTNQIDSLDKLDFYLAMDQRAIGKCIVQAKMVNNAIASKKSTWYIEQLRNQFVVDALLRLSHTPYYKMRHYEFPNGY